MKRKGFPIDVKYFEKLQIELVDEIAKIESIIIQYIQKDVKDFEQKLLNEEFPVKNKGNYPKVLAKILGIPLPVKKNKNGQTKVTLAEKAIQMAGLKVNFHSIRGGTDGSRLSEMGIPTPNIFSGGLLFHSRKEYIPTLALQKACEVLLNLGQLWASD